MSLKQLGVRKESKDNSREESIFVRGRVKKEIITFKVRKERKNLKRDLSPKIKAIKSVMIVVR